MKRFPSLMIALALLTIHGAELAISASPQRSDPQEAVERLFREPVREEWFAETFLAAVPASQVTAIVSDLTRKFGSLITVVRSGDAYLAKLERADVPIRISLDTEGRIAGLFAGTPIPTSQTLDDIASTIKALPGKTSLLILTDGKSRLEHRAGEPMGVASAAKLAVLAALDEAVKQGRLAWDQVVRLDLAWRTLPTSQLIGWPERTPVTIATLANFMISVSDNMATDGLIQLVGRTAVEAMSPRNKPFLTTAEIFKLQANEAELEAWTKADDSAKRALLDKIRKLPLPDAGALTKAGAAAEWFISAEEICALLDRVAALPAMTINPGLANAEEWQSVAYKGGSDLGVLNYSSRLVAKDGTVHCVVATWNDDKTLAQDQLTTPYLGILHKLAASGG